MDKAEVVEEFDRRLGRLHEIYQSIIGEALDNLNNARDELFEWFDFWHDGVVEDSNGA